MPFVDADLTTHKRRWQYDDQDDDIYRLYGRDGTGEYTFLNQPPQDRSPAARKILPLNKRARLASGDISIHDTATARRRPEESKAQYSQPQQNSLDASRAPSQQVRASLLTPCHICHRKPTKKNHLDAFAECQGCGERTCFVCIRQCYGSYADDSSVLTEQEVLSRSFHMDDVDDEGGMPCEETEEKEHHHHHQHRHMDNSRHRGSLHEDNSAAAAAKGWAAEGHRSVVCSRCCVERGAEGDVVCLGCLSRVEGV